MDRYLIAQQLVRAVRGRRSQEATNRRLGRRSNVLHAWETGARYPSASDFLRLLEVSGRVPTAVLGVLVPCEGASRSELVSCFLRALRRDIPHATLASRLGVNRNTIARWLMGATEPRLPDLLAFVEVASHRLLDFIGAICDPQQVPHVARASADLEQQRRLAYSMPWTHAVLRALELEDYRRLPQHEPGFIAAKTGLSLEQEQECLRALARSGQIKRRRKLWRLARVLTVDTRENPVQDAGLKLHWATVAAERLGAHGVPPDGFFSYNLFAVAECELERIRRVHLEYYERLRSIVASSRHPTRVVLANLQLVPLG